MGESHFYCIARTHHTHTFEVACNFVHATKLHRGLKPDSQMSAVVKSSVTFLVLYEHHTISEVYNTECVHVQYLLIDVGLEVQE